MSVVYFNEVEDFAEWLTKQLEITGMNVLQLAKKTGLSQSSLYGYVHGNNEPSYFAVLCICKVFGYKVGVTIDDGN